MEVVVNKKIVSFFIGLFFISNMQGMDLAKLCMDKALLGIISSITSSKPLRRATVVKKNYSTQLKDNQIACDWGQLFYSPSVIGVEFSSRFQFLIKIKDILEEQLAKAQKELAVEKSSGIGTLEAEQDLRLRVELLERQIERSLKSVEMVDKSVQCDIDFQQSENPSTFDLELKTKLEEAKQKITKYKDREQLLLTDINDLKEEQAEAYLYFNEKKDTHLLKVTLKQAENKLSEKEVEANKKDEKIEQLMDQNVTINFDVKRLQKQQVQQQKQIKKMEAEHQVDTKFCLQDMAHHQKMYKDIKESYQRLEENSTETSELFANHIKETSSKFKN